MGEMWVTPVAKSVQEAAGMQFTDNYIGRREGMVDQWVVMLPIFEVYKEDKFYGGGSGGIHGGNRRR